MALLLVLLIHRLFPESEMLIDIGVRAGLAIVIGFRAQRTLFLVVGRSQKWIERAGKDSQHARRRAKTVGHILRNLITTVVVVAVTLYVLSALGWDIRPLLATAGIAGVALGFGAQTLVRDVIAGMFIIFEDQFAVGDLIEVNGKAATVE
jgi:small-conductance mechanosensitive channel